MITNYFTGRGMDEEAGTASRYFFVYIVHIVYTVHKHFNCSVELFLLSLSSFDNL